MNLPEGIQNNSASLHGGGNGLGVTWVILFRQIREGLKWKKLRLDFNMSLTMDLKNTQGKPLRGKNFNH